MKNISYSLINHHGAQRIAVSFEFNKAWNERISKVAGAKWSKSLQCWHIPDTIENRKKCNLKEDDVVSSGPPAKNQTLQPNLTRINENNKEELNKFIQQLILKAYSPSTIRTYRNEFIQLLQLPDGINVQTL